MRRRGLEVVGAVAGRQLHPPGLGDARSRRPFRHPVDAAPVDSGGEVHDRRGAAGVVREGIGEYEDDDDEEEQVQGVVVAVAVDPRHGRGSRCKGGSWGSGNESHVSRVPSDW